MLRYVAEGIEINLNGDLSLFPDKAVLRVCGESYLERLREMEEYEKEGERIAEEKRLDLKKRVSICIYIK